MLTHNEIQKIQDIGSFRSTMIPSETGIVLFLLIEHQIRIHFDYVFELTIKNEPPSNTGNVNDAGQLI